MPTFKAHFDGKVFIPDEPVDFPINQQVLLTGEPVAKPRTDFRAWIGQGLIGSANPNPRFKNNDELWEGTDLPKDRT